MTSIRILLNFFLVFYLNVNYSLANHYEGLEEMIAALHNACVDESGVDEKLIAEANKGNFQPEQPLKCYMKCLMATIGVMDEDGYIDHETFIGMLPESLQVDMKPVVEACKDTGGSDGCDRAFNMHVCTYQKNPKIYHLI